jgi:thiamine-phosphate pyrophosphorylase
MNRRLPPPLVALSPGGLAEEGIDAFLRALASAVAAGLSGVMLRETSLGDRPFLELARACRELLDGERWLAVHDRVHLAEASDADAVHLGFRSLPLEEARAILDRRVALGLSAHAPDASERWRGADYLVFGPVRDTPSKRGRVEPTGLGGLARAVERSPVPVWAIGGLRPDDVEGCLAAGCRGIAVLSGILPAHDPAAAARDYLARIPR